MTTPDPREDSLAKAREAIEKVIACLGTSGWTLEKSLVALAALSALPSRSESDDEKLIEAMSNAFWGYDHWDKNLLTNMRRALAVARKALTLSPTPYVRPAADIRARLDAFKKSPDPDAEYNAGYLAGLTFALTPPTQEQR